MALEELAVVASHGQCPQRLASGAAWRQLQGHAGGGDDLRGGQVPPQRKSAQQQAVKARIGLGQHAGQGLVVGGNAGVAGPGIAGNGGDGV